MFVVLAVSREANGEVTVTVAPITHAAPKNPAGMIKLTPATQRRLGLDADQCWVVATEVNEFKWPGPDVVVTPDGRYAYGELPEVVFLELRKKLLKASASRVQRTK
ncbi:MAG: growth inhibitor PemK [Pseudomonadota bacterium]